MVVPIFMNTCLLLAQMTGSPVDSCVNHNSEFLARPKRGLTYYGGQLENGDDELESQRGHFRDSHILPDLELLNRVQGLDADIKNNEFKTTGVFKPEIIEGPWENFEENFMKITPSVFEVLSFQKSRSLFKRSRRHTSDMENPNFLIRNK